ncbi:MAG: hypothetical protein EOO13_05490 [Chitinophagaceae bacterium]|nr:MAG: hypothetical protein EOO13_05490 [Chitinophagaceae bacterium]
MPTEHFNASTRSGTLGGTVLALLFQINWSGLVNTAIVAAVGASTSFMVSVLLRWLGKKCFQRDTHQRP